jgi:hypothetical protein
MMSWNATGYHGSQILIQIVKHLCNLYLVLQSSLPISLCPNLLAIEALLNFCFNHLLLAQSLLELIYNQFFQSFIFFHSIVIMRVFFLNFQTLKTPANLLLNDLFRLWFLEFLKQGLLYQIICPLLIVIYRVLFQKPFEYSINFLNCELYQLVIHLNLIVNFDHIFLKWVVNFENLLNCWINLVHQLEAFIFNFYQTMEFKSFLNFELTLFPYCG